MPGHCHFSDAWLQHPDDKRMHFFHLENILMEWILQQRSEKLRVSRKMVQAKALELWEGEDDVHEDSTVQSFAASNGWLQSFFDRHDVTLRKISLAKVQLFNKCDPSIIGSFKRHVNTSLRTKKDANVDDIIETLRHLDRSQSCPIFAVSAGHLNHLPRSAPEELNDISVVDRECSRILQ